MTREELKKASAERLMSALEYSRYDSIYATFYDEVTQEIRARLKKLECNIHTDNSKVIANLQEQIADLKQSLDWANEREADDYKEFENLRKENEELKVLIKNLHEDIFHLWEHHPQVRGHKKHIEDMAEVEKFLEETK